MCATSVIFLKGLVPNMIVWGIIGLMQASYYPLLATVAYNKFKGSSVKVMGRIVATGFLGSLIVAPLIGTLAKITNENVATLVIAATAFGLFITFWKMKIENLRRLFLRSHFLNKVFRSKSYSLFTIEFRFPT